jgi:tryptophan 2,3-dioxygenase
MTGQTFRQHSPMTAMQTLEKWLTVPNPHTFPYESVIQQYHLVGKHFVEKELLFRLGKVRDALSANGAAASTPLRSFLDVALDKYDGRYDYLTYTGLSLLALPGADRDGDDVCEALHQRDRLVSLLVTDALRFERAAAARTTLFLPRMRPDWRVVTKRCHLGLRVTNAMFDRIGVGSSLTGQDPVEVAWARCAAVCDARSVSERIALRLSMLPVYVVHDEYLFIRVLQSFEATFALLVVQLRVAIETFKSGDMLAATLLVDAARSILHESAPLFSLLATMQVESFGLFRQFTDGASAIQSENYKTMESLCRWPDGDRLDSLAYRSVPTVRRRLQDGDQPSLEGAYLIASAAGRLTPAQDQAFTTAVMRFAAVLKQWRRTHYHLAVRMLGEATGTGQTEGTPYLRRAIDVPIFDVSGGKAQP